MKSKHAVGPCWTTDLLLLRIHSRLLIGVGASRRGSLPRILITIGIMPAKRIHF